MDYDVDYWGKVKSENSDNMNYLFPSIIFAAPTKKDAFRTNV